MQRLKPSGKSNSHHNINVFCIDLLFVFTIGRFCCSAVYNAINIIINIKEPSGDMTLSDNGPRHRVASQSLPHYHQIL